MNPNVLMLRFSLIAFVCAAVGVFVYAVAATPSRLPNYLGIRGLKRVRALQEDGIWTQIEPLVRWFAMRIDPLLSNSLLTKIDRLLTGAGDCWGLLPEEVVALCAISGAFGMAAGSIYGIVLGAGVLYVFLGAFVGFAFPYFQISSIEGTRRRKITQGLPWAVDLLALGLSAGLDFPGALRQVVDKSSNPDDPLIEEFNLILQELQVGKTRKQALLQFAERMPTEAVREFVGAIVQAEERGNPLGDVLRVQAETSRLRRGVRAEELASKASVKLLLPMGLLLVAVMILIVAPLVMDVQGSLPN
jgi:tight adherence protein C